MEPVAPVVTAPAISMSREHGSSTHDRDPARSAAESNRFGAIAEIQINLTAADLGSCIHHGVNPVVSAVQASQPDHRTKWQHVRVGSDDAIGDPRPCRGCGARAICGDGERDRFSNGSPLCRRSRAWVPCAALRDDECDDRDDARRQSQPIYGSAVFTHHSLCLRAAPGFRVNAMLL
jgi:hypothetical protein